MESLERDGSDALSLANSGEISLPIEIVRDGRLYPVALRLYALLRIDPTISTAASASLLQVSKKWVEVQERQLVDLGYLEITSKRTARGRERTVTFPPVQPIERAS